MCVEDEPGVANAYAPLTVAVIRLSFTPYAWVEMMEAGLDIWCPTSINGHTHLTLITSTDGELGWAGGESE